MRGLLVVLLLCDVVPGGGACNPRREHVRARDLPPEWIALGTGHGRTSGEQFYGVGSARNVANVVLCRSLARSQARSALADELARFWPKVTARCCGVDDTSAGEKEPTAADEHRARFLRLWTDAAEDGDLFRDGDGTCHAVVYLPLARMLASFDAESGLSARLKTAWRETAERAFAADQAAAP